MAAGLLLLGGCVHAPMPEAREARASAARIEETLGALPPVQILHEGAGENDYLLFAVKRHPAVRAAYAEWQASIEAIGPATTLPDPKLTFEADIADTLMTLMPGLMFDFMAPGKRAAMGREAAAASRIAYSNYASTVMRVAAEARRAWVDYAYVLAVTQESKTNLAALERATGVSESYYTTAKGMADFQDQASLASKTARMHAEIVSETHRLSGARTRFKSALGLLPEDDDPPWPSFPLRLSEVPTGENLWRRVETHNADLASMRAMVEMAVASVDIAKKAGIPDFAIGGMVDLKADPLMFRPQASITLPIWRDKIAAGVASAAARKTGAEARLSAEKLTMAAQLAQMLHMLREAEAMVAYLDDHALPNLRLALRSAEASAASGMGNPAMLPELEVMLSDMRLERLAALREHEIAATDLLWMLARGIPDGVPLASENAQP